MSIQQDPVRDDQGSDRSAVMKDRHEKIEL